MGLLSLVSQWRRRRRAQPAAVKSTAGSDGRRICRFEHIEPRYLLSGVPLIQLGAVYQDAVNGQNSIPNTFTVSWSGGAAGTQLSQLTIETDPNGAVTVQPGDPFFETSPGPPGVYGSSPLSIVSSDGFTVTGQNPADGSTVLVLNFNGFTAGRELVFTIEVDDMGPNGADATVNGHEFQNSKLIGVFSAPHYEAFSANGTFYDAFNPQLQASGITNLPDDSYVAGPITPGGPSYPAGLIGGTTPNTTPDAVYTAGAFVGGQQAPLPISLEGDVYYNPELDNQRHNDDTGIGGVQLTLLENANGAYVSTGMTTVTDATGHYKFGGVLPGDYEIAETEPNGYFAVGSSPGSYGGATYGMAVNPNAIGSIDVLGGELVANLDFSQSLPNSISGTLRVSPIGAGDASNPPLEGVTVQLLDSSGKVLATTTTAADGTYRFTNLRAGVYTVHELVPAGYYAVSDLVGSEGGNAVDLETLGNIVLTSNERGAQYDFYLQQPVSIAGTVRVSPFGALDSDSTPLGGATIQLLDAKGNVLAATTAAQDGTYRFTGLHAGQYTVHELLPNGYYAVDDIVGNEGGTALDLQTLGNVTLTSGQNGVRYDFYLQQPVSIAGTVRVSPVGTHDSDSTSLGGVTILLGAGGNVLQTATTAADGTYSFQDLKPGSYTVHELVPNSYQAVDDLVGSDGGTAVDLQTLGNIALSSGENGVRYDFYLQQPVSIAGTVRVSPVGTHDSDSTPLGGVTIQLLDAGGNVLQTATTAADGTYSFQDLKPGSYTVHELVPNSYQAVDDLVGSDGGTAVDLQTLGNISLSSGQNGVRYDFYLQQPVSISGIVRSDIYGDCETHPNDPPVSGVTIQLLDAAGNVIATTTTDARGIYSFSNLHSGTYGVHELLPAGYFDGDAHVGSAGGTIAGQDLITSITLTSGTAGSSYNFCLTPSATISGFVFQDGPPIVVANPANDTRQVLQQLPTIRTGVLQPGDARVAGVTLELADAAGRMLLDQQGNPIQAVTDANGFYQFAGLPPGTYTVVEVPPSGYLPGIDTAGTLGGLAIDPALVGVGAQSVDVSAEGALLQSIGADNAIAMIVLGAGQSSGQNNFSVVVVVPLSIPTPQPAIPQLPGLSPAPLANLPQVPAVYALPEPTAPPVYSRGGVSGVTWHLSVIDAGMARGSRGAPQPWLHLTHTRLSSAAWRNAQLKESLWTLYPEPGEQDEPQQVRFGRRGGIPVTGDFNGDGVSDVGVYVDGQWFIDLNGNGVWDQGDLWAKLGHRDDKPITGDWDGDGKTDIGVFGRAWAGDPRAVAEEPGLPDPHNSATGVPKNMPPPERRAPLARRTMQLTSDGELRADVIDHVFHFGTPGDIPVTGDWTGCGIDSIGIFRDGQWVLDLDGDGKRTDRDRSLFLGQHGDQPIVGDFDGDGVDELGVYRDGVWLIDINHDGQLDERDLRYELGGPGDRPVVGDFNGDGVDQIGVERDAAASADES